MARSEPQLTDNVRLDALWPRLLAAVLVVSAALRAVLVVRGGQMLWSDESRYQVAREAAGRLAEGELAAALRGLFAGADHLLFKLIGLVPAFLERWTAAEGANVPAFFFASFSVLNVFLVWRIARTSGAGRREAFFAALFLAVAATNFFYARHLFPYDLSLTFGLLALACGLPGRAAGAGRSLACGALAGLAFLSYNGAWLFGAVILVAHTLAAWPDWRRLLARAAWAGLGLALPIATAVGVARLVGTDLIASFLYFSGTINQGDFGRGLSVIAHYFWAAEGFNAVLALAGLALALGGAIAARTATRGLWWALAALVFLAGLWLPSDVWHKFVVYGRTARFVLPFVCLAGAFALERLWRAGGGPARAATLVAILVFAQGVANLWPPLRQVFPGQFNYEAAVLKNRLREQGEKRQLVVIYADMLVGERSLLQKLPDHDVLLAERNPMQYAPYLFEGFTEANRALLLGHDVRMRLIAVNHARFDHPSDLVRPFPGVVRLTVRLPELRVPGVREPLVVTGETGRGDFIYLMYQEGNFIRIGFDHWGYTGKESDPIPFDPVKPLEIVVSMGPLHDPARPPDGVDPRRWLYVEVNGQVVWSHATEFHSAPPDSIAYFNNYIGGSTAGLKFTGQVQKIQSLLIPPFADQAGEKR